MIAFFTSSMYLKLLVLWSSARATWVKPVSGAALGENKAEKPGSTPMFVMVMPMSCFDTTRCTMASTRAASCSVASRLVPEGVLPAEGILRGGHIADSDRGLPYGFKRHGCDIGWAAQHRVGVDVVVVAADLDIARGQDYVGIVDGADDIHGAEIVGFELVGSA